MRALLALLLVASLFPAAATAIELDPSQAHLRIDGGTADDFVGARVSGTGDINGDGLDDLLVAATGTNLGGGSVFVIYGSERPRDISLVSLPATQGFRIDHDAEGNMGYGLGESGDVDGDGFDDVVIGYTGARTGRASSGGAFVIYGAPAQTDINLTAGVPSARGFRIIGAAAGDSAGWSASAAGDINGDGLDDVVVNAPDTDSNGRANSGTGYVVYGAADHAPVDLAALTPAQGFRIDGPQAGDGLFNIDIPGDLNGDGRDDVVVSTPYADNNGRTGSGSAWVLYGAAAARGTVDLAGGLTAAQGFRIDGAAAGDGAGAGVSGAGDHNGDGRADLLVGAPAADPGGRTNAGSAYVVYGAPTQGTLDLAALSAARGYRIDGPAAEQRLSDSAAPAGDINADGYDDVMLAQRSRAVWVLYGAPAPATPDLASGVPPARGFRIAHTAASGFGTGLAPAGDTNGDGRAEIIIGDPLDAGPANQQFGRGSVYVFSADFLPRVDYAESILALVDRPLTALPTLSASPSASLTVAPPLPAGLALDARTGRIAGTPRVAGLSSHTVILTDPVRGQRATDSRSAWWARPGRPAPRAPPACRAPSVLLVRPAGTEPAVQPAQRVRLVSQALPVPRARRDLRAATAGSSAA